MRSSLGQTLQLRAQQRRGGLLCVLKSRQEAKPCRGLSPEEALSQMHGKPRISELQGGVSFMERELMGCSMWGEPVASGARHQAGCLPGSRLGVQQSP